ncbi:hypothetical protein GGU10DRAFT_388210 [Lentinula aff. detonsa]|uniref:Uncharacterized protein n=1 Tax=Lentinula aff. detonsa TaxID=2804958 RepID=A0AA38L3Z9_9AGAR|nr:hypothetical protein GGU10DRAFT_388210 [Lentinula aff. detonsa]
MTIHRVSNRYLKMKTRQNKSFISHTRGFHTPLIFYATSLSLQAFCLLLQSSARSHRSLINLDYLLLFRFG